MFSTTTSALNDLNLNVLSLNVRGLGNTKKLTKMLFWLSKHGGDRGVTFFQESHSNPEVESKWRSSTKGEFIMSHGSPNSRGVAIHIGKELEYKILTKQCDLDGRYILLLITIQGADFLLINSYAPNNEIEQVAYFKNLFIQISTIDYPPETHIIWGGDFNNTFELDLESSGGNPTLKLNAIESIESIKSELDLIDIWRLRNPSEIRYTWRGKSRGKQVLFRRLDYFFISDDLQPIVKKTDIIPAPATDHSAIVLELKSFDEGKRGPSFWKFNNSLLNDNEYVKEMSGREDFRGLKRQIYGGRRSTN